MIVKTKCNCGHVNQSEISVEWAKGGAVPIACDECGDVYMATSTVDEETYDEEKYVPESQTNFEIASRVIVQNEAHELNNQEGIVCDKDFLHYKVQFKDGKTIWLPHHWVILKKSI